jgi:cobalt-precorrin 5A hydrolase/precorrin-3B C17-methyltransferase
VKPVIFILGISALPLAQKLKAELGGEIHTPGCVRGGDAPYAKATAHLAELFQQGRTIIGLCASGILIRAIAPHLKDKRNEPPVVAVAEDGSSAVPLLGGHHGANDLARKIALSCSGHAAITTASDQALGVSFDQPVEGHTLENYDDHKAFAAALLSERKVRIVGSAPWLSTLQSDESAALTITVTDKDMRGTPHHLIYHPQTLTVGIGCERGTAIEEVDELVETTLKMHGLSWTSVACLASVDIKADEPAIGRYGSFVRYFTVNELRAQTPRISSPSEVVEQEVGTPSVAEAAALAAAGPDSELIVAKVKSKRATCAIARAPRPILDPPGRLRGRLSVVGIGPGFRDWRAPAARVALQASTEWVGYDLYLDLISDIKEDQTEHRFPLGGEEDRVRHAIELAKLGKRVALICSGDAGIYAMAALVYEIIDLEPSRIKVEVIPGISAFQAAAAKAGAMIGHDFCCISLSDLLTPWEAIEKRVKAAAEGDFVISFYNPRSMKRRDQLERAFAILKAHRPPDTPVIIASNLGRAEENVRIVKFADFNPDDVDMLTLVMVGSSQSKSFARGDGKTYAYTPRGYAKKREIQ